MKYVLVKNELNELLNKFRPISMKGYSFSLGRIYFTSNGGLQNMFVYQPTFSTIKSQETNAEYVLGWRSKGVYVTDLVPIKKRFFT